MPALSLLKTLPMTRRSRRVPSLDAAVAARASRALRHLQWQRPDSVQEALGLIASGTVSRPQAPALYAALSAEIIRRALQQDPKLRAAHAADVKGSAGRRVAAARMLEDRLGEVAGGASASVAELTDYAAGELSR